MRPIRLLFFYFVFVFLGGALLAPWVYELIGYLAAHGGMLTHLAASPFPRFINRCLLVLAVIGIVPLLKSCGMLSGAALGLKTERLFLVHLGIGLGLGFISLAVAALLALVSGNRSLNTAHSGSDFARHIFNAAFAALLVSVLEEIIFRGTLFGVVRKAASWQIALVVSSAVYALVHFLQKVDHPVTVTWSSGLTLLPQMFMSEPPLLPMALTLFVAGAILALAYQKTGSLYLSMGLHAGWIFWLKFYGFLTVPRAQEPSHWWGSDRLIDGWACLPILLAMLGLVWRIKFPRDSTAKN